MANSEQLPNGVSVIVCCFNSSDRLRPTLEHLALQQTKSGVLWELLIIDNASTDDTAKIAADLWQEFAAPVPIRIITEPNAGTDHARRRGVFEASYRYFVFCDDDNWLAPAYIITGHEFMDAHPNIGLAGGAGEPVASIAIPEWFNQVAGYYAACAPAASSKDMTDWGLWGAGMFGQTAVVRKVLPKEYPLIVAGRVGQNSGVGEDGEICMRVALVGYKLWYYDALRFKHWIGEKRLTENYRDNLLTAVIAPSQIIASYLRALRYRRAGRLGRYLLFTRHFIKWISKRSNSSVFTNDYCYFATGSKTWENQINSKIKGFINFCVLNK